MSGLESSKPLLSATGLLRAVPDESKLETDLAALAARFSAQSGGGLSAELSADLALEIVLNEIVEQACLATGATGAAVVLLRDGEMVCRASSGPTAPELGSRLDTESGLSGACFKTRRTQWCDDVLLDTRVDIDASARLGVRSVVVMPLLRGSDPVGMIELFSARPYAFGVRDERTLEVLADRTLNNLERAAHPLDFCSDSERPPTALVDRPEEDQVEEDQVEKDQVEKDQAREVRLSEAYVPVNDALEVSAPEVPSGDAPGRSFGATRWLLAVSAVVCAVLVALLLGRQWGARHANSQTQPAVNTSGADATRAQLTSVANADHPTGSAAANAAEASPAKPSRRRIPPGGLLVLRNGAEVFRLPPNESAEKKQQPGSENPSRPHAAGPVEIAGASADSSLLYRVEPEYPEAARQQNIQGTVVLDVHIGADGAVQDVRVGTGSPPLAQAASDAVKQWKFKPRLVNGRPVEMQTRVTMKFRLAQ